MIYFSNNHLDLLHSCGIPYNAIYDDNGKYSCISSLVLVFIGISVVTKFLEEYIKIKKKVS